MKILTDKELIDAWEKAFKKHCYFGHKPTGVTRSIAINRYIRIDIDEEVFLFRLRAIAQAQLDKIKGASCG